ncbi:Rrf2 family transcriptional regulator [Candidatus Parcubacteria bacterium]|nr:MAG: Rrf2 family transcriptional regulator [Candidatus Parcubacteria bacterium]
MFSTRTTYGLRALAFLAEYYGKRPVSLAEIANQEGISRRYLEKIFVQLKKANLVISAKGAQGGYFLAAHPRYISFYDAILSLEGDNKVYPFHCWEEVGRVNCGHNCQCGAHRLMLRAQEAILATLKKMTLARLVK